MTRDEKTRLTRERILSAAMDEFGRNGYAGASLNNICAAGIPKGLLYHNFKSKDALYLACVGMCFDGLTAHMAKVENSGDFQQYMSARLDYFREHENEACLFFDAVLQPPEALRERLQALRCGFDTQNRRFWQKLLSSVCLREGVSQEQALRYFNMQQAMFNGYFSSPVFRELSLDEKIGIHEAWLPQILDFMLYGIAERKK